MRVLTVRQPWAWAICFAGKDVENRAFPAPMIGERIGIHAAKRIDPMAFAALRRRGWDVPSSDDLPTGLIVATTTIVDLSRSSTSEWARRGMWHWILADTQVLARPVPHRGSMALSSTELLD